VGVRKIRGDERRKMLDGLWGCFLKFIKEFKMISDFRNGKF
jgi:hypothetical protein